MEDFCKRWQAVFYMFDALKTANISNVTGKEYVFKHFTA